jgi:hypothetical protein
MIIDITKDINIE